MMEYYFSIVTSQSELVSCNNHTIKNYKLNHGSHQICPVCNHDHRTLMVLEAHIDKKMDQSNWTRIQGTTPRQQKTFDSSL